MDSTSWFKKRCWSGGRVKSQPVHLTTMQAYRCSICGHIYDEKTGDTDAPPGTSFEALPEDWHCPVCLAEKGRFSPFVSPLARLGL
ncbi:MULTISPECIES: rubredoxin [unclassified Methanoculleus]|uniref:rubredoxin n=1 Tax=unclassified Methanoculleus TaxID=2619537 RepID=UPI002F40832D